MGSVEDGLKSGGGLVSGVNNLLEEMKLLKEMQDHNGAKRKINSELWHACAGPLVTLPQIGSLVYYFPQGHSEQVAVSISRSTTIQTPNYPNLPSQLLCQVHNVTLHADKETDEIYAQMSLQPVNSEKDVFPIPDFGVKPNKHPTEYFCKTLTASDTSTHGGFSVPRRAAEKLFPQLDYTIQPPTQELAVRDLHGNMWTFRHVFRGQPKRHLLTTGWSMFIGAKRLRAGDAVLFIRDEKSQMLLGVRRASRQQTTLPSSVLSTDSMHIGILAAAAHATANRTPFTIFYNPRACPSEFVIPLARYRKYLHATQPSVGMRFGMMLETEESSKRRYMGTIIGTSDLDPLRWPDSKWRSLQVEWDDEPGCGDKHNRVNPWEIESPESLVVFPSLTACLKRPFHSTFLGSQLECEIMTNRPYFRVPDNLYEDSRCPSISKPWSEQLMSMLTKEAKDEAPREPKSRMQSAIEQKLEMNGHDLSTRADFNNNPENTPPLQTSPPCFTQSQFDPQIPQTQQIDTKSSAFFRNSGRVEFNSFHTPSAEDQELWDLQINSCLDLIEGTNSGSTVIDPSVSSAILDDICALKNVDFPNHSDYLVGNLCGTQDVQSQITTASLADSLTFSGNVDFDDANILQQGSFRKVTPRFRTYTKIQKAGSVGRSIDVSSFRNYNELCSEIERMFNLESLLNDSGSGWKLVYVDFENDVLLVGDDPWEEFVSCVRCIRILSPTEVKQMGEEGMQLLNSAAMQGVNVS